MKNLIFVFKKFPFKIIIILFLKIINVAIIISDMYFMNKTLNALIQGLEFWNNFIILSLIVFLSFIISIILKYTVGYLKLDIKDYLRLKIIQAISLSRFEEENNSYSLNSKLLKFSTLATNHVVYGFLSILNNIVLFLGSLILLALFHWSLVIIAIFFGFITAIVPVFIGKKARKYQSKLIEIDNIYAKRIGEHFSERNRFYLLGKLCVFTNIAAKITNLTNEKFYNLYKKIILIKTPILIVIFVSQLASPIATALLAKNNIIDLSVFGVSSFVFGFVFTTITSLPDLIQNFIANKDKMNDYLKIIEVGETKKILSIQIRNFNPKINDNVLYKKPINLKIDKDSKIIIEGKNGVGKSVFFQILRNNKFGFDGKIKINNVEKDKKIALIENEDFLFLNNNPYIFPGTLENNISLFQKSPDIKRIKEIKEELGIKIKLSSNINISQISSGQKQKISIARLFYQKPKFVFLDESLSNIDKKTHQKISNKLLKIDSAVIWISHREVINGQFKKIEII